MKWPSYIPYPISFLRTFFQIAAIFVSVLLGFGDNNDIETFFPRVILSPFGLVSFLLVPILLMTLTHWIFQNILHQMKGVSKPRMLESLWEGIFGWMTAMFSCTLTTFFFVIPTVLAIEFEDNYYNWDWGYVDDSDFLFSCFIIYTLITLCLYQLEHVIRFSPSKIEQTQTQVSKTSKSKNIKNQKTKLQSNTKTRIQSSSKAPPQSSTKQTPPVPKTKMQKNVTPDEIDLELEILKRNHGKQQ